MASTKATPLPSLWTSFKSSFYNPEFYKKIPSFSFGKAFGYLAAFVTLCYFMVLIGGGAYLWSNREKIESTVEDALDAYPADLELTFTNGKLSTNVTEPYFYPGSENTMEEGQNFFVVIDTKTPFSTQQFNDYDATVWLTADAVYVHEQNQGMRMYPYDAQMNFTLNRENIHENFEKIQPVIKKIALLSAVVVAVFTEGILLIYSLLYLLFPSLLYFILSQIHGKKHGFETCYKTAMYALTPVTLLQIIIVMVSTVSDLHMPPFLFTAVLLLTIFLNVREPKSSTK